MNKTVQMMLAERFPVFAREKWQAHWPLKVGIHVDILARAPEIDKKSLAVALRHYTQRRMYLLADGTGRALGPVALDFIAESGK